MGWNTFPGAIHAVRLYRESARIVAIFSGGADAPFDFSWNVRIHTAVGGDLSAVLDRSEG